MAKHIQSVRGMQDILPAAAVYWRHMEAICRQVVASYGYSELRTPIVEDTMLFKRSIGEVTDIVEKEMYTFVDRNQSNLSLRPEGTAGCVRAGLQHGLFYNQVQRLWYMGPMFRHERPQKGRTRQFHQFGVEAIGMSGPAIDAELIIMNARIWEHLGLQGELQLQINSLGTSECRQNYRQALVDYLQQYEADLDDDSKRRLHTNPLRILDSKNPGMQSIIAAAPKLADYYSAESKLHFDTVCEYLDAAGISFTYNSRLVRGLDYYSHTVFEWVSDNLGAQGTVSAGGRYDSLITQLGSKKPVSAAGFALGFERLQLLLADKEVLHDNPHVYFVVGDQAALSYVMQQAEKIRSALPGLRLQLDLSSAAIKTQFKRADQSGASWALVCGSDELAADTITIKNLHELQQQTMCCADLIAFLCKWDDTLQVFGS